MQADNLCGDHNDVHGKRQVGGHQWEHPHAQQAPGQIK